MCFGYERTVTIKKPVTIKDALGAGYGLSSANMSEGLLFPISREDRTAIITHPMPPSKDLAKKSYANG